MNRFLKHLSTLLDGFVVLAPTEVAVPVIQRQQLIRRSDRLLAEALLDVTVPRDEVPS